MIIFILLLVAFHAINYGFFFGEYIIDYVVAGSFVTYKQCILLALVPLPICLPYKVKPISRWFIITFLSIRATLLVGIIEPPQSDDN